VCVGGGKAGSFQILKKNARELALILNKSKSMKRRECRLIEKALLLVRKCESKSFSVATVRGRTKAALLSFPYLWSGEGGKMTESSLKKRKG